MEEKDTWPVEHNFAYGQRGFSPDNGTFTICACGRHAVWHDGEETSFGEPGTAMRFVMYHDVVSPAPRTDRCEKNEIKPQGYTEIIEDEFGEIAAEIFFDRPTRIEEG